MNRDSTCRKLEVDLTAYHQGELAPERRAEIAVHLGICDSCAAFLADIESVFSMAGEIEDLAPSMRFKREVSRALERRPEAATARGLGFQLTTAAAFLVHRFHSSRRFKLAAVSVGAHVVLLLVFSFAILPRMADKPWEGVVTIETPDAFVEREASDADQTGRLAPDPGEAANVYPVPLEQAPVDVEPRPELDFPRVASILPPAERVVHRRPTALFASLLAPEQKERRLATILDEPKPVIDSVARALAWLAARQEEDGSWAAPESHGDYRTGVSASALLAFLSDGHSLTRGTKKYRRVVKKGIDRLLSDQLSDGDLEGLIGPARGHYTYNHALATMALVETYCLDYRRIPAEQMKRLKAGIRASLALIVKAQKPDGGWRYEARLDESFASDTSVSIFQVMALASARGARFTVPEGAFAGFDRWLRSVTAADGIVGYQKLSDRAGHPRTLTAGALFLEEFLGLASPLRSRQAREIRKEIEDPHGSAPKNGLLRFYSTLAFGLRGDPLLGAFSPEILRSQERDGRWEAGGDEHARFGGDTFLTALNILTLTSAY